MENDSDYIASSESDTDNSSVASITPTNPFENMSEEDIYEVALEIYTEIDEFFNENILSLSSPKFYTDVIEYVTNVMFSNWMEVELCDNDDDDLYADLLEYIENIFDIYIDFCGIPRRSYTLNPIMDGLPTNIEEIKNKIEYLKNLPQPQQRTPEWYEFRNSLISASNLWKVFGSDSQVNSLIYEKCQSGSSQQNFSSYSTNSPLHWGNKYEEVTKLIYEDMYQTKVGEFGCIQHSLHKFIGASPDGINIDPTNNRYGRMLEIKNIVNREITGIPKEEYWVQTQIQMETCDLDECDFLETRIIEYPSEDEFYSDTNESHLYKGVVLHFIERDQTSASVNIPRYKYMPIDTDVNRERIDDWIANEKEKGREEGLILFNKLYWYLDEISCVLITRNKQWFSKAVSKIENIWNIILKERVEGFEHRATKKKQVKISVVTSDTSSSYVIENLNLYNSVCLIKLDEVGNVI